MIYVLEGDMRPVTFNGGAWSLLTIEFAVVRADPYSQTADYRTLTSNKGGKVGSTADPMDDQKLLPVRQGGSDIPPGPLVGPQ